MPLEKAVVWRNSYKTKICYAYIYMLSSLLKLKTKASSEMSNTYLILASWHALLKSFCLHAAYCSRDTCAPSYGSQCHWSVSFCALSGWTWLSSAGDKYHIQKASHPCGHVCGSHICLDNKDKSVSMNCNMYNLQKASFVCSIISLTCNQALSTLHIHLKILTCLHHWKLPSPHLCVWSKVPPNTSIFL